jgi:hypothetical protein
MFSARFTPGATSKKWQLRLPTLKASGFNAGDMPPVTLALKQWRKQYAYPANPLYR